MINKLKDLSEIINHLENGSITSNELVHHYLNKINLLDKDILNQETECCARIRSTQDEKSGKLKITDESGYFLFDEPISATSPGQACVFYKDDQVLGGGWIT